MVFGRLTRLALSPQVLISYTGFKMSGFTSTLASFVTLTALVGGLVTTAIEACVSKLRNKAQGQANVDLPEFGISGGVSWLTERL